MTASPLHPLPPNDRPERPPAVDPTPSTLSRELGGNLPCIVCSYNLRGMSIAGVCPECGTRVRATILSVVDPKASELQPISSPRLVAAGIVLWAVGGLVASIALWAPVLIDVARLATSSSTFAPRPDARWLVIAGAILSGLGALSLVRPHARIARSGTLAAILAVALYIPLLMLLAHAAERLADTPPRATLASFAPDRTSTIIAASTSAVVAAVMLLLRPNARLLVARSILLRTGRVDRQTMLAMAAAAALVAWGFILGHLGTFARPGFAQDASRIGGLALVVLGAMLLTLGLAGSVADCVRIARAIVFPRPTLHQLLRPADPAAKPHPATPPGREAVGP
jgi:hypothetical protein